MPGTTGRRETGIRRRALALAAACATIAGIAVAPAASAGVPEVKPRDRTEQANLGDFDHTHGTNVDDYDGDGILDVMLVRHYASIPWLMINKGGVFDKVGRGRFVDAERRRDYHSCPSADLNRDGLLDFYCTVGGKKGGTAPNPNELWIARPSGKWVKRTGHYGVADRYGRGREAVFLHANGDRWPDLYVTNDYPRQDGRRGPNKLFLNKKGERFERDPDRGLDGNIGGDSARVVDYDGDGDDDVALCAKEGTRLFENRRKRFADVTGSSGAASNCVDADLARYDRDARPDLVILRRDLLLVRRQKPNGTFRQKPAVRKSLSRAADAELGDVNGDGRADIYVIRAAPYDESRPRKRQVDVRDKLFVSKGRGRIKKQRIPQDNRGIGDRATAIDHDGNGLDDFIVQNGAGKSYGPTRLIAFYPKG